jgi:hypothetical protein
MARINDLGEYKNKKVDNEALKTSGREVIGVTDRTLADYDTSAKALLDTLANREQQKMFAQHVAQDRVVVQRQLLLHEHDQLDRQGEIDFRSGLDRYASDAGLRWTCRKRRTPPCRRASAISPRAPRRRAGPTSNS